MGTRELRRPPRDLGRPAPRWSPEVCPEGRGEGSAKEQSAPSSAAGRAHDPSTVPQVQASTGRRPKRTRPPSPR